MFIDLNFVEMKDTELLKTTYAILKTTKTIPNCRETSVKQQYTCFQIKYIALTNAYYM